MATLTVLTVTASSCSSLCHCYFIPGASMDFVTFYITVLALWRIKGNMCVPARRESAGSQRVGQD